MIAQVGEIMTMVILSMNKQKGYIDIDLRPLIFFAVIGVVALALGIGLGGIWLFEHLVISFV